MLRPYSQKFFINNYRDIIVASNEQLPPARGNQYMWLAQQTLQQQQQSLAQFAKAGGAPGAFPGQFGGNVIANAKAGGQQNTWQPRQKPPEPKADVVGVGLNDLLSIGITEEEV